MPDTLFLVQPSLAHQDQILAYKAETLAVERHIHGSDGLASCQSVPEWLNLLDRTQQAETCPPGRVPANTYLCIRSTDQRLVGMVNIRHHLNDYLLNYAGHIGYSIRPADRGQGYGKVQLRLALDLARQLGLQRVLLTCDDDNPASAGTILANGGRYEDSRTEPGEKTVDRYWIKL